MSQGKIFLMVLPNLSYFLEFDQLVEEQKAAAVKLNSDSGGEEYFVKNKRFSNNSQNSLCDLRYDEISPSRDQGTYFNQ